MARAVRDPRSCAMLTLMADDVVNTTSYTVGACKSLENLLPKVQ